ncbi:WD40-repeat-containing domain protein [Gamsiella multidivaricata]|uniref:WD40-repeat-containing domain protein n=1 Tax=Gamsiella multidivaricata TaxID=101098 RepID=UPI0022200E77|nr:WD40-repeat-containing domain protein [Gamsiella multidivaricata]KAI7831338.1 WD40-repeat-containing domain protein [Gamsiella multidivaricata]
MVLTGSDSSYDDQNDDEGLDKALAYLFSQAHIARRNRLRPSDRLEYDSRRSIISSVPSLESDKYSIFSGPKGYDSRQTYLWMHFPELSNYHSGVADLVSPTSSSSCSDPSSVCPCTSCERSSSQKLKEGIDGWRKACLPYEMNRSMSDTNISLAPHSCSNASKILKDNDNDGWEHKTIKNDLENDIDREDKDGVAVANGVENLCDSERMAHMRSLVPRMVRRRINHHFDECWYVRFSPSGEYMASIGLDQVIHIWKNIMSLEPSVAKTFTFDRSIVYAEWSPNSRYMVANLGLDYHRPQFKCELYLLDIETGETVFKRSYQAEALNIPVTAVSWFSDSERFMTALQNGLYCVWNVQGKILREYRAEERFAACQAKLIPGTDDFAVVTNARTLEIISFDMGEFSKRSLEISYTFATLLGAAISKDGAYALLTNETLNGTPCVALYNLKTMTLVRTFEAESFAHEDFTIFPTFAGPNEELVCTGSENGKLHYWDLRSGELVTVLEEHTMHVGCTDAHPRQPGMMASCSDDGGIIIWMTEKLQREVQDDDEKWLDERRPAVMPSYSYT